MNMNDTAKATVSPVVVGGLTSSAVLIDLTIASWTGRKKATKETEEVIQQAHAKSSDAAHVTKKLFVDNPLFKAIGTKESKIRDYLDSQTMPWMGKLRLLPIKSFTKFQDDMRELSEEFNMAVDAFCADYSTALSAQAFKLGSMFNRKEYPSAEQVKAKFRVDYTVMPLPTSGDFRVEAEKQLRDELQQFYEKAMAERINDTMRSAWEKLHECLTHMSDRLGKTDGKNNIFRDSMLENAQELCNLLTGFNITNDPKLERARAKLWKAIENVEPEELRKNDDIRADVKASVDEILSKFKF